MKEKIERIIQLNLNNILSFDDGLRFGAGFTCGVAGVFTIAIVIKAFIEWVTNLN